MSELPPEERPHPGRPSFQLARCLSAALLSSAALVLLSHLYPFLRPKGLSSVVASWGGALFVALALSLPLAAFFHRWPRTLLWVGLALAGGAPRGGKERFAWWALLVLIWGNGYWLAFILLGTRYDLQHEMAWVAAFVGGSLLFWVVHHLGTLFWKKLPRLKPVEVLAPLSLGLIFTANGPVYLIAPLESLRYGLPLAAAAIHLAALLMALESVLSRDLSSSSARDARLRSRLQLGLSVALVGYFLFAPPLSTATPTTRLGLQVLTQLTDRDGDGRSAYFSGSDCDDSNPEAYPFAPEIVGNGVDEDCDGSDLTNAELPPLDRPRLERPPLDVVLLSVDTLRADHLTKEFAPHLHAFAQGSRRFSQAYAAASFTSFSLHAVFTGRIPSDFTQGVLARGLDRPLAEIFSSVGYASVAVHPLDELGKHLTFGFTIENKTPSERHHGRDGSSADVVTRLALQVLRGNSTKPKFVWIHYLDPHHLYLQHPGYDLWGDDNLGKYRGEIAYMDAQMAPLLRHLEKPEVKERTIVLFFSDHGEFFGERGLVSHFPSMHHPVLHVPLFVRGPGIQEADLDTPVSLLDVFPTIVDAAGIRGMAPRDGQSLLNQLKPARHLISEARIPGYVGALSLRQDNELLSCEEEEVRCELFNLAEDERCERDISASHPERTQELLTELKRHIAQRRNDVWSKMRQDRFNQRFVRPEN